MIERRREEGGKLLSDPLKYHGTPRLELIDWNLHAKLATSLHKVEPMPEKPRDKGPPKPWYLPVMPFSCTSHATPKLTVWQFDLIYSFFAYLLPPIDSTKDPPARTQSTPSSQTHTQTHSYMKPTLRLVMLVILWHVGSQMYVCVCAALFFLQPPHCPLPTHTHRHTHIRFLSIPHSSP